MASVDLFAVYRGWEWVGVGGSWGFRTSPKRRTKVHPVSIKQQKGCLVDKFGEILYLTEQFAAQLPALLEKTPESCLNPDTDEQLNY